MIDEVLHHGEDAGIIGDGGDDQLVIAVGTLDGLGHVVTSQVEDLHLLATVFQHLLHDLGSLSGVAVDGTIDNGHALVLRLIAGPGQVLANIVAQVFLQDGAVEGADGGDVQSGCLLEQSHDVGAVLAHDVDIVTASFAVPIFLGVQGAELAKAVGGEQNFLGALIADHDFRPVDHGSHDEGQGVVTQLQGVALVDDHLAALEVEVIELFHHGEQLGVGDELHVGILLRQLLDAACVVRFHVVDDQVVRQTACQSLLHIGQPLGGLAGVYGVHDGDLVVHDDIRVIGDAVGHDILALEQVDGLVVHAHVQDRIGNVGIFHNDLPPYWDSFLIKHNHSIP